LEQNDKVNFIKKDNVFVKPNFTYYKADEKGVSLRKRQGVFVGRIEEIKGIESLLEAWKEIKEVADGIYEG
jgi:glycosyltransferase involved in cell wall biosynthesis